MGAGKRAAMGKQPFDAILIASVVHLMVDLDERFLTTQFSVQSGPMV